MQQLIAVVDKNHRDQVTRELLRLGVLHFITMKKLGKEIPPAVKTVSGSSYKEDCTKLRNRIESLLDIIHVNPIAEQTLSIDEIEAVDREKVSGFIDGLVASIEGVREKQRQIQQEILKLEDLARRIPSTGGTVLNLLEHPSTLLEMRTGGIAAEHASNLSQELQELPATLVPLQEAGHGAGEKTYLLITLKRYKQEADAILSRYGWWDVDLSQEQQDYGTDAVRDFQKQLTALKQEQASLRNQVEKTVEDNREKLERLWRNLRLNELYNTVEEYYGGTGRTVAFAGWVPKGKRNQIVEGIRRGSEGKCYIEWHNPERAVGIETVDTPVQFTNPRFLKPFQMLVENYSIPEYGTFDPTPVVAIAFLCMFGLMFGDAGHGLVLLAAGLIGARLKKGEPFARLFHLISWCGASATIMGVLFGSYFGMAWFPPLWFDYHGVVTGHVSENSFVTDIYGILQITIVFGIVVIATGLWINWFNLIRKKRWLKLFLDKTGILGGWMYGAGVYTAFYFGSNGFKELPSALLLFWILGVPALLFFLKPVLEFILHNREHGERKRFSPMNLVLFVMDWIVEMLEIFSGYLANTLSFMRVAGLGIAHVSLMTAFFQIASMVGGETYTVGSIVILVLGNLLVIILEGLSAGIQSLRLNYYEFFTKYFSGSGTAYMPVTLKRQVAMEE